MQYCGADLMAVVVGSPLAVGRRKCCSETLRSVRVAQGLESLKFSTQVEREAAGSSWSAEAAVEPTTATSIDQLRE